MIKPIKIEKIEDFKLKIRFNNQELRLLSVFEIPFASQNQNYFTKLQNDYDAFKKVKIGSLGQIMWGQIAEMKDKNGKLILCEFDMSPEFVYHNSILLNE
jgi:hypothetical protein